MNTFVAFFRGINVGGKNKLPMKELVSILDRLGCEQIKTYIQSGNAVFQVNKKAAKNIAQDIQLKILEECGFKPNIVLFDAKELQNAIDRNPFKTDDGKVLHFFLMQERPKKPDLDALMAVKSKSEEFKLNDNVFYLYAPDGIGRSKLATKVERCMGVPVTARNWNTIRNLIAMVKQ